jgi:hypothetical protein
MRMFTCGKYGSDSLVVPAEVVVGCYEVGRSV